MRSIVLVFVLAAAAAAETPAECVYVTNYLSHTISVYRIDAGSGALHPVPGSPFATSGRSVSAAVDPSNRFLYVVSRDEGTVEGFAIGPTGALTPLAGSPFPGGPAIMDPSSVVVVPSGRFLYITDTLFDRVRGYGIDVATGALSPVGTPVELGANADALSVDPSGRFLYAARSGFTDDLYGFWLDPVTGSLSPTAGPLPLGGRPGGTAVHPSGRYLFVASAAAGVTAYALDPSTGFPAELDDSPYPGGAYASDVTLTPSGRFAYVTDAASSRILGYEVDATTGGLTPIVGVPATTGWSPGQLIADPSGRFVYAVDRADDTVSGYTIGADGALTAAAGSPVATGDVPAGITATNHDLVLVDDFESGGLGAWSLVSTGEGDLSVSAEAARYGTLGLAARVDDATPLFVRDDTPQDEGRYRARFLLDPSRFDPGLAQGHRRARILLGFRDGARKRVVALILRRRDNEYALGARVLRDDGTRAETGFIAMSSTWHAVQLDWKRASAPGASDGSFQLFIDEVPVAALTGLDNDEAGLDSVQLGAMSLKPGASGMLFFDRFDSRRYNFIWPTF